MINTDIKVGRNYGIYRHCLRSQTFWLVRIRRDGKFVAPKSFFDHRYGSEKAALLAARTYRDQLLLRYHPLEKRKLQERLRRDNVSGVPGVCRVLRHGNPAYIAATQLHPGRQLRKYFRIDIYGEEHARALAIAERKRQLRQVDGVRLFNTTAYAFYERLTSPSTDSNRGSSPSSIEMSLRHVGKGRKSR